MKAKRGMIGFNFQYSANLIWFMVVLSWSWSFFLFTEGCDFLYLMCLLGLYSHSQSLIATPLTH